MPNRPEPSSPLEAAARQIIVEFEALGHRVLWTNLFYAGAIQPCATELLATRPGDEGR